MSVDYFTVPTTRFQVLCVFLVLAHERRRILHFGVTAHPTAEWTAQQLRDAFPWDATPRYLLRDRDRIFGDEFTKQVKDMGIEDVLSVPQSHWQRAYIERLIGVFRRECLDHVIVFNEALLDRHVKSFGRTLTSPGRTSRWPRTRRNGGACTHRNWEPSRRLAVFTTGTSRAQPEIRKAPSEPPLEGKCVPTRAWLITEPLCAGQR